MSILSDLFSPKKKPATPASESQVYPSNNKYKDITETSQNINQRLSNTAVPKSSGKQGSSFHMYDVIKDFDWTTSNVHQIYDEVPYILLQEFKIAANSQMASLITNAMLMPDVLQSSKASVDAFSSAIAEKAKKVMNDRPFSKFMDSMKKTAGDVSKKIGQGIDKSAQNMQEQFSKLDNTTDKWADQNLAAMYKFLYIRKPTDRWYKFPYFNSNYYNITNSFQSSDGSGNPEAGTLENIIGVNADYLKDIGKFANITALTEPGSYTQKTKFYKFTDDGPKFSVKFVLYNTISEDAFIRNNIFLQTLIIQNTPHRHNRLLVDPPCIYEVTIPGRGFYPFCSINNIVVAYKGVQRVIGGDSGKDIIVPDAFEVTLDIESLTSDVNNFMVPEFYDGMSNLANERGNAIGGTKSGDKPAANTTKVVASVPSNRGNNTPNTSQTVSEKQQQAQADKDTKYTINGRSVTKEVHDAARAKADADFKAAFNTKPTIS
jgi:hypothetical protein